MTATIGTSLTRKLAESEARIVALEAAVRRLEWAGGVFIVGPGACPACLRLRERGHAAGCWLAAAIAGKGEEVNEKDHQPIPEELRNGSARA